MNDNVQTIQKTSKPCAVAVVGGLLLTALNGQSVRAETKKPFTAGVNYPWIAYGHDFGKNQWDTMLNHRGLDLPDLTDSQGFTDTRFSKSQAHTGAGSLSITADLIGQHPNKAKGEVYIDLRNHTPPGVAVPINLKDISVSCWLLLPSGSLWNP